MFSYYVYYDRPSLEFLDALHSRIYVDQFEASNFPFSHSPGIWTCKDRFVLISPPAGGKTCVQMPHPIFLGCHLRQNQRPWKYRTSKSELFTAAKPWYFRFKSPTSARQSLNSPPHSPAWTTVKCWGALWKLQIDRRISSFISTQEKALLRNDNSANIPVFEPCRWSVNNYT